MSEYPGDENIGWILAVLVVALVIALCFLLWGINISSAEKTQESGRESADIEVNALENNNRDIN